MTLPLGKQVCALAQAAGAIAPCGLPLSGLAHSPALARVTAGESMLPILPMASPRFSRPRAILPLLCAGPRDGGKEDLGLA